MSSDKKKNENELISLKNELRITREKEKIYTESIRNVDNSLHIESKIRIAIWSIILLFPFLIIFVIINIYIYPIESAFLWSMIATTGSIILYWAIKLAIEMIAETEISFKPIVIFSLVAVLLNVIPLAIHIFRPKLPESSESTKNRDQPTQNDNSSDSIGQKIADLPQCFYYNQTCYISVSTKEVADNVLITEYFSEIPIPNINSTGSDATGYFDNYSVNRTPPINRQTHDENDNSNVSGYAEDLTVYANLINKINKNSDEKNYAAGKLEVDELKQSQKNLIGAQYESVGKQLTKKVFINCTNKNVMQKRSKKFIIHLANVQRSINKEKKEQNKQYIFFDAKCSHVD